MLDKLFFIYLVLNATELFRFIAPPIKVTIGQISIILLVFNVIYLLLRLYFTTQIILRMSIVRWFIILLFWPLLTSIYSPMINLREIGLQFYYFTLFLGTIVYIRANGLGLTHKMLTVSLIITIIGMPISILYPNYFEATANLADALIYEQGRPLGFFLQPNTLSTALILMFIGWYALLKKKNMIKEMLAIIILLGLEIFTGSRTGTLVSLGVISLIFLYKWPRRLIQGQLLFRGFIILSCLLLGIIGLRMYVSSIANRVTRYSEDDLLGRMESMLTFEFSSRGNITEDVSVRSRIEIQEIYINLIKKAPILGHGFSSDLYYREKGETFLSSHSQMITSALEYGLFYPISFCMITICLLFNRKRCLVEEYVGTNTIKQFVAASIVLFIYSYIRDQRNYYIILGIIFIILEYPEYLFNFYESKENPSIILKNEIKKYLCK